MDRPLALPLALGHGDEVVVVALTTPEPELDALAGSGMVVEARLPGVTGPLVTWHGTHVAKVWRGGGRGLRVRLVVRAARPSKALRWCHPVQTAAKPGQNAIPVTTALLPGPAGGGVAVWAASVI